MLGLPVRQHAHRIAPRLSQTPAGRPPRARPCMHRIFWNAMSEGPTGYVAYSHSGWGAEHGEREKRKSWRKAMGRRADDVEFVPFSIEAGGV